MSNDQGFVNYKSVGTSVKDERAHRQQMSKGLISTGVTYIDDCLGGIAQDDLLVIAGRSGEGKSELANNIALNCAASGKKVFYFGLEAAPHEVERRLLFKALSNRFYADDPREREAGTPDYQDWYLCKQDYLFEKYYDEEMESLSRLSRFLVRYRDSEFTVEDFERNVISEKDSDLFVLDHLHYFDFTDKNENEAYKKILKQIRRISAQYQKPVVLVCHVRKADRKEKSLVPGQEDIHGSSDIFKIATRVVTLAPAFDVHLSESHLWATYMRAAKNRLSSARTRYVGLLAFNSRNNYYEQKYTVGQLSRDGSEFNQSEGFKVPNWAKHHRGTI